METRFTKLATETTEWSTGTGAAIVLAIELVREDMDVGGNVGWVPAPHGLSVMLTMTVDGRPEMGHLDTVTGNPVAVARFGRIGIKADRYALIQAAIARVEAHPEFVAHCAAEAEGARVTAEHEAHVAAVESMMTLGGRTY